MTRYADEWESEIGRIAAIFVDMSRQLAGRLAQTWRGVGSDASLEAVQRYVAGSLDGLRRCQSVAQRLTQLSHAAGEVRAVIIAPSADDTAGQRHILALDQVRQLYSQPAVAAGNAVDDIPPPPEPFGPRADASSWSVPTATAPAGSPATGIAPQGFPSAGPHAGPGLDGGIAGRAIDLPAPSHASGFDAPSSSQLAGLPDRSLPGLGPGAAPTAATAPPGGAAGPMSSAGPPTAAPSRAGMSFMPYLGPLYPGYAGRDSGSDHPVASYLISIDNGHELIGPLPKVAPPVIGE